MHRNLKWAGSGAQTVFYHRGIYPESLTYGPQRHGGMPREHRGPHAGLTNGDRARGRHSNVTILAGEENSTAPPIKGTPERLSTPYVFYATRATR